MGTLEDAMSKEEQGLEPGKYIKLRPSEVQSGSDRVLWAEGLIRQLPEGHNGRDSWLLNYAGDKHAADVVTAKKLGLAPKEDQNDDWVPKVGQLVFYIPGSGHSENPKEGVVGVITHGPYNYSSPQVDVSFPRVGTWAYRYKFSPQVRPLTPAEIEAHDSKLKAKEDADKLAKLKPGLRVRTEIGDGMYVREDVSCMRPYLVLRDTCVSVTNHQLSDITILD
jgi:hypothetical protein